MPQLRFGDTIIHDLTNGKKKRCRSCNVIKDINEFSKDPSIRDGRSTQCKVCRYKYTPHSRPEPLLKVLEIVEAASKGDDMAKYTREVEEQSQGSPG